MAVPHSRTGQPCAFIAADYILLGRLARYLRAGQHLLIPPTKIMIVFLMSDITTFLIQAAGGGVSIAADTAKVNKIGSNIFLAGLAIQLASFVTFTVIYIRFLWLVWRREPTAWSKDHELVWWRDWRALAGALGISCVGIIVRVSAFITMSIAHSCNVDSFLLSCSGALARLQGRNCA